MNLGLELERILNKSLEVKVVDVMEQKARSLKDAIHKVAVLWKNKARKDLGHTGGYKNTSEFPYKVSGALQRSLHYSTGRLVYRKRANQWSFVVSAGFRDILSAKHYTFPSGSSGTRKQPIDYGELHDKSGKPFGGFKQRIMEDLRRRIEGVIR